VKILITGGAGYIGHHLAWALNLLGAECYVIDNLSRGLSKRVPKNVHFDFVDLTDSKSLKLYMKARNFDVVYHLAALMQARESMLMPAAYELNNVQATVNLLETINSPEKCKFIFSSSCSVYGNNSQATIDSPMKPLSKYAETKVESELKILEAYKDFESNLNIFRFFNVIGCDDRALSCDIQNETLLPASARRVINGIEPLVYGNNFDTPDGFAIRDFIDVRDLITGLILPLNHELQGVHNLSTGSPTSIGKVLLLLLKIANREDLSLIIKPQSKSDPSMISAKPSNSLIELGWQPHLNLQSSIESFWNIFLHYYTKASITEE
jgi:UDP-glucose 4-epimerase